ncbi:recQ-mediated genome instability protein 1 isoform X2 [Denticeps clupeoides]|nr:recQ-mediated genome instability protein 1 isoform X2 [Denticeps clupeoides]
MEAVGSWLRSRWQVLVPDAWLEACVGWVVQESGDRVLDPEQLQQQVLEQWLLTDLRALGQAALPEDLAGPGPSALRGCACVQVDSLLDVSQPAYSQLQRCRGDDCSDQEVCGATQATQATQAARRPARMLMLQLTDGVRSCEALELRPVPALRPDLPPGTKLLLQGPIACRLGVLLLGPENVRLLGGEVEALVERNRQVRLLSRALGLPEAERAGEDEGPRPTHIPGGPPDDDDFPDDDFPLDELDHALSQQISQDAVPRHQEGGSAPFTYLCTLQAGPWPPPAAQEVRLQAFIVTLQGSMRSRGGQWGVAACISDGTGYLEVELSDAVLTGLVGLSAGEWKLLRRDDRRRAEAESRLQRCQRRLVDMCCIFTVRLDPAGERAVVLSADTPTETDRAALQERVEGRRGGPDLP